MSLEHLLSAEPSSHAMDAIITWMVASLAEDRAATLSQQLPRALAVLAGWPDRHREGWIEGFDAPVPHPLAPLLRRVSFDDGDPDYVLPFFASPNIAHLTGLDFFLADEGRASTQRVLDGVCGAPGLRRLSALSLTSAEVTDDDLARLLAAPALSGLTALTLHGAQITDRGAALLAGVPSLARLDLAETHGVTAAGLAALRSGLPGLALRAPDDELKDTLRAALKPYRPPKPANSSHRARLTAAFAFLRFDMDGWTAGPGALPQIDQDSDRAGAVRWAPGAWETAFSDTGALHAPLALRVSSHWYMGGAAKVQTALSTYGLRARLVGGTFHLAPDTIDASCDLIALCQAFAALFADSFFASPCHRETTSFGWEDAHAVCDAHTNGPAALRAVFWNFQGHCFDADGNLDGALAIQWAGPRDVIAAALRDSGLAVDVPPDESRTFRILPR